MGQAGLSKEVTWGQNVKGIEGGTVQNCEEFRKRKQHVQRPWGFV